MLRKQLFFFALTAALAACESATPPDTVESLVADPAKLNDVMSRCHADHAKVGDAECNAASEAFRRRFENDGKPPYTPSKESPKF